MNERDLSVTTYKNCWILACGSNKKTLIHRNMNVTSSHSVLLSRNVSSTMCKIVKILQVKSDGNNKAIDIREWDSYAPTQHGVTLSLQQWSNLIYRAHLINLTIQSICFDDVPDKKKFSLGGLLYVEVNIPTQQVDFRLHYEPEDGSYPLPSEAGITLNVDEWKIIYDLPNEIEEVVPEMKNISSCSCVEHVNVMTVCPENYRTAQEYARVVRMAKEGEMELPNRIAIHDIKIKLDEMKAMLKNNE